MPGHDSQLGDTIVKKGVIALLIILALVVLVSPGIVGRMAESSMDEQVQWAASGSQELVVTTESFDRGWFASEGVHRVELGQTGPGASIREAMGIPPGEAGPALVVNTTLDHGLIPVTSVTREEGSLMPGLARAVSTMTVEMPGGESWEIPGVVYSNIGLGGGMSSNYYLEAGSFESVSWGAGDIRIEANPSSGAIAVDGGFDSVSFDDPSGGGSVTMSMLEIDAETEMTEYGYSIGDVAFTLESIEVVDGFQTIAMGPMNAASSTSLEGSRMVTDLRMDLAIEGAPIGEVSYDLELMLEADAEAIGRVIDGLNSAQGNPDPMMAFASMEPDLIDLVGAGLEFRIDRLDISLPQGTMEAQIELEIPENKDMDSFVWSSLLLDIEAAADLKIPTGLFDLIVAMNPQANMAVAMGMLRQDGDNYVMEAEYKQGLLTVNGAPMPIPMPGS